MSEKKYNSASLIKLQDFSWYLLLGYFIGAVVVELFHISVPFHIGYAGVLLVLFLTLLKLILIAEQFRKIRFFRLTYIAYGLLLIILLKILVRLYL